MNRFGDGDAGLTAVATARRVLAWAGDRHRTAGTLPSGQLRRSLGLATPDAATEDVLCELTRATGARLGAGAPPFGDEDPIGLGALLLAAAIGGRAQLAEATLLALALPPARLDTNRPGCWADGLARHAVVGPYTEQPPAAPTPPATPTDDADPPEPLAEVLLRASPLTAVLHRPEAAQLAPDGATDASVAAALALLSRRRGRGVLVAALSGWSPDPLVLAWRTQLLGVLGTSGHAEVVADTYLAARTRHGRTWDTALGSARAALQQFKAAPDEISLATVRYWLPLAHLGRDPMVLRRPRLVREARPTLDLVAVHRRWLVPVVAA